MSGLGFLGDAVFGGFAASQEAKANKQAANASREATALSVAEQKRQYDTTRADFMPWHDAGVSALGRISDPNNVMANFQASPDYNFRMGEGTKAVTQNRAVGGLLRSGSALKALSDYAQGTAAGEFGNWWNRQSGLAGVGQQATGAVSNAGQNAANNNSAAYMQNGRNLASSYQKAGDIWSGYTGQLAGSLDSNAASVFKYGFG